MEQPAAACAAEIVRLNVLDFYTTVHVNSLLLSIPALRSKRLRLCHTQSAPISLGDWKTDLCSHVTCTAMHAWHAP